METKVCSVCKKIKPIIDFDINRGEWRDSRCKQCRSFYEKENRKKRKELGLCTECGQPREVSHCLCHKCASRKNKYHGNRNRIIRRKNKQKAVNYLGGFCKICGIGYTSIAVYDFHHEKGKKEDILGNMFATARWERIQEELNKCVLMCANCHRLFHVKEL